MPKSTAGDVVLQVDGLKKYYDITKQTLGSMFGGQKRQYVKANETISFRARESETVAIVGESGCGKSTLAKVMMGLELATEGKMLLDGKDLSQIPVEQRPAGTVGLLQMVFQNPFDTLNPSHTVGSQIERVIRKFDVESDDEKVKQRVMELLDLVKLPRDFYYRRPRQLSGGQKQRIGIARAFAGNPRVVVADEPVSALDVSVQAAVTGLLTEIQNNLKTTLLFISHDLSVVRYLSDRIVVMYLGHIVEKGSTDNIFAPPYHPYTEALLSAVPIADTSIEKRRIVLDGELPSAVSPPPGCPFQTRCPRKLDSGICEREVPETKLLEGEDHAIACHIPIEELRKVPPVFSTKDQESLSA